MLASSREGWANVLLESMACGTPVIATDVGGNREVVAAPQAGTIIGQRSPEAMARAVGEMFEQPWDRGATRGYAEQFGWDATTAGQLQLFDGIIARARLSARWTPAGADGIDVRSSHR